MTLPRIDRQETFSFTTASCGELSVFSPTVGDMKKLDEFDHERGTSEQFISILMKNAVTKKGGDSLSPEDIQSITYEEKEDFALQFIEKHQYLCKTQRQLIKEKKEDGSYIARLQEAGELKKKTNESNQEYLYRAYKSHRDQQKNRMQELFELTQKQIKGYDIFGKNFLQNLQTSVNSSQKLQDTLSKFDVGIKTPDHNFSQFIKWSDPPPPQFNTIESTNSLIKQPRPLLGIEDRPLPIPPISATPTFSHFDTHLENIGDALQDMHELNKQVAQTVQDVSVLARDFTVNFGKYAEDANKSAKKMLRYALVTLALTFIALICSLAANIYVIVDGQQSTNTLINNSNKQIQALNTLNIHTDFLKNVEKNSTNKIVEALQKIEKSITELDKRTNNTPEARTTPKTKK